MPNLCRSTSYALSSDPRIGLKPAWLQINLSGKGSLIESGHDLGVASPSLVSGVPFDDWKGPGEPVCHRRVTEPQCESFAGRCSVSREVAP